MQPPSVEDDEILIGPRLSAGRRQFGIADLRGLGSASTPRLTAAPLLRPALGDPLSPIQSPEESGALVNESGGRPSDVRPLGAL